MFVVQNPFVPFDNAKVRRFFSPSNFFFYLSPQFVWTEIPIMDKSVKTPTIPVQSMRFFYNYKRYDPEFPILKSVVRCFKN